MMKERRGAKRISTDLVARWDTPVPPREGKIIDLSANGCFILTAVRRSVNKLPRVNHVPAEGSLLIEVHLSPDERLELRAEVVYRVERVGFAARFLNLAPHEEEALRAFIEKQETKRLKSARPPIGRGYGR